MKRKYNNLSDNIKRNKIQCDCNCGTISYLDCIKGYKDTIERNNLNMEKTEENYKSGELSESEKTSKRNKKVINDTLKAKTINFEKNYRKRKIDSLLNKGEMCFDYKNDFCYISDAFYDYKKEPHIRNNTIISNYFGYNTDNTKVDNIKVNEILSDCNNMWRLNTMTSCEHNYKREAVEEEEERKKKEDALGKKQLLCNKGNCCCITNTLYLEINEYLRKLHLYKMHRKC